MKITRNTHTVEFFWSVHSINFPVHDHFHCMFAWCGTKWCHVYSVRREKFIFELLYFSDQKTHRTIRRTMIFSFDFLEKNNDECILILVIDWKKTGLVRTKISNHNLIYSS